MAAAIHLLVPKTAYTLLLESVDRKLPIYEMLVNGIVEKDCKGGERVEFSAISLKKIKIREFIKKSHPHLIVMIGRVVFENGATEYKRLVG